MIPSEPIDRNRDRGSVAAGAELLSGLNEPQQRAITQPGGAMLVLAGAGSGKTRVITQRVAHLILARGVMPWRIVAVTFTNKAAAEMRERVTAQLGGREAGAWICTFHSMCLRILRRDGERIGLGPGFNVYDSDDQLAVIKRILKADEDADSGDSPRAIRSRISRAKNALMTPDTLEQRAFTPERRLLARTWRAYQEMLRQANAVDFDDLLLMSLDLMRRHEDVAARYAERCEHLLVDEYQDTNRPQYLLVRALSAHHGNVCVVGDEDQCIYRFRGAELRNILEFETDHPGAEVIRLEQNYRSTANILRAAGAVVANNRQRKGKTLWTDNPAGDEIELFHAPDDRTESSWTAQRARELSTEHGFDQMAVLYRTNAQSRQLEEAFRQERIPFQVVGAVQFYARKEIKDLLAYLRLAANPADDVSLRRVVNTPPRGIGTTTLNSIEGVARTLAVPLLAAARHAVDQGVLGARAVRALAAFLDLIDDLDRRKDEFTLPELLETLIATVDYEAYLDKSYGVLASERVENVRGLISATVEYLEEEDSASLAGFLDRSALVNDSDDLGREPGVTLMTVHTAKGLEFPVVFLAGLEENLFPHAMAVSADEDVEEERRLCYVAMTRARQRLLLAHARFRRFQGALIPNPPSRFLAEIPADIVREVSPNSTLLGEPQPWSDRPVGPSGSSAARAVRPRGARTPAVTPHAGGETNPADGFGVGAFVRHPRFGGGRIVGREGSNKGLKLTIQFSDHGVKKILPAYTRLQVERGNG